MARSLPVENLLPQNAGPIINYLQYTEAAQWGTPSCSPLWNFSTRNRVTPVAIQDGVSMGSRSRRHRRFYGVVADFCGVVADPGGAFAIGGRAMRRRRSLRDSLNIIKHC